MTLDATLSILLNDGSKPLLDRYVILVLNDFSIVSSVEFSTRHAISTCHVQSYRMNTTSMLTILQMGKVPVLPTYIVPSFLSTNSMKHNNWLNFPSSTGGFISLSVSISSNVSSVVLIPFYCRFTCPLPVDNV